MLLSCFLILFLLSFPPHLPFLPAPVSPLPGTGEGPLCHLLPGHLLSRWLSSVFHTISIWEVETISVLIHWPKGHGSHWASLPPPFQAVAAGTSYLVCRSKSRKQRCLPWVLQLHTCIALVTVTVAA